MSKLDELVQKTQRWEELISEGQKLLSEIDELKAELEQTMERTPESSVRTTFRKYIEDIDANSFFWLTEESEITHGGEDFGWYFDCNNPFNEYPRYEYARMAKRIKLFNDMLFAFKWCYETNDMPDWSDRERTKYTVVYDENEHCYTVLQTLQHEAATVYFCKESTAQLCVNWLNTTAMNFREVD